MILYVNYTLILFNVNLKEKGRTMEGEQYDSVLLHLIHQILINQKKILTGRQNTNFKQRVLLSFRSQHVISLAPSFHGSHINDWPKMRRTPLANPASQNPSSTTG